jgi:rhodanese-related sulfurtransferase
MTRTIPQPRRAAGLALALGAALSLLLSCSAPEKNGIRSVSQDEIVASLGTAQVPLLLDVRTKREFNNGHLPDALLIPVGELSERLEEVRQASEGREVVVYCERGARALKAGRDLVSAGFEKVGHLEGDMAAWRTENRPIER